MNGLLPLEGQAPRSGGAPPFFALRPGRTAAALLSLFFLLALAACDFGRRDPRQEAAITVDGRSVSVEAFKREFERKREIYGGVAFRGEDAFRKLRYDLANEIIERLLVLEEAGRLGIGATDEEVRNAVDEVKAMYRDEDFKKVLLDRYIDFDEWRDKLKEDIIVRKTVEKILGEPSPVGEEEIRDYYDRHIWDYRIPEMVHASQIVVASRKEADEIYDLLKKKKADFAALARERSIGPEASQGGDLGYFRRGQMPPEFDKVVFKVDPGKFSEVVQSPYGFHIFLVHERRPAHLREISEVHDEIAGRLRETKQDRRYVKFIKDLRAKARIKLNEKVFEPPLDD